jgi:hypothetical protein
MSRPISCISDHPINRQSLHALLDAPGEIVFRIIVLTPVETPQHPPPKFDAFSKGKHKRGVMHGGICGRRKRTDGGKPTFFNRTRRRA